MISNNLINCYMNPLLFRLNIICELLNISMNINVRPLVTMDGKLITSIIRERDTINQKRTNYILIIRIRYLWA